jgi:hypothetical protein
MRFLLLVMALALASPVAAQDLGAREQWQPQIADIDARLAQSAEIEIIGRAAVPALEILSEATGVSLSVAPEDLGTVGERKLTVISKGLSLKAIMVQLPEALQECHWDIEPGAEEPVYFLHRNAGVDNTVEWLSEQFHDRWKKEKQALLLERLEQAEAALKMTPEQLAELDKSDPLLARSMQDPHSRDLVEILLSLPPAQARQFRETGGLEFEYTRAPERMQQATHRIMEWYLEAFARFPGALDEMPAEVRNWREHLTRSKLTIGDCHTGHGFGVWLSLVIPTEEHAYPVHDIALHPRHPSLDEGQLRFTRLLRATGAPNEDAAFEMAKDLDIHGFRVADAKREERHKRQWIEPTDPALLQTIVIGDRHFSEFAEVQAFIAEETGIPVISDYFTLPGPYIPDELREGVPLWRLLYVLGEDDFLGDVYLWEKVGDCLVFHRVDWYSRVQAEVPESIIADYRGRVEAQGELTIDDLAELAMLLDARDLHVSGFPRDLQRAGIHAASPYNRWGLLLYASLSPEQQEKLRGPGGLSFDEMTIAQQRQVLDRAAERPAQLPGGATYRATFHLVESVEERHGRTFAKTELQLRFPEVTDSAMVTFKLLAAKEEAAPAAAP